MFYKSCDLAQNWTAKIQKNRRFKTLLTKSFWSEENNSYKTFFGICFFYVEKTIFVLIILLAEICIAIVVQLLLTKTIYHEK